mmetsp:Transcript_125522/g.390738  ORF Transcript_125522/g.390738 Transcript_125522/m.390738 type:complete len:338 (+) Transcript_125522:62-1075(+)
MQDLPPEAFWQAKELRGAVRVVTLVALSYCWLHPVNPDPEGKHLRILQHALRLRLGLRGPGRVQDLALFIDYMSLPQHGETGDDPAKPEKDPLLDRTPDEAAIFKKGLGMVNITYANQQVEVWLLKWVPESEPRKYMDRGWPFFEQAVSGLIKDATNLVQLSIESLEFTSWVELYESTTRERDAPIEPGRFGEELQRKTFTNGKSDMDFVQKKYTETFNEVVGGATTLFFPSLGWSDAEADRLVEVLPLCHHLELLFVGDNNISPKGQRALADAAARCETLRVLNMSGNPVNEDWRQMESAWLGMGKRAHGLRIPRKVTPVGPCALMEDSCSETWSL